MTDAYDLIAEARSRFGELSEAEAKLLRAALSGEVAYCGPSEKDDDPANDPAKADEWGEGAHHPGQAHPVAKPRSRGQ